MASEKRERGDSKLAIKSGFWYIFSSFVTKGLAFLTTPIFARLMSSADYGEFTNFALWQSMLLIIISMELYATLARAYFDHKDDFDGYASTVTYFGFITTVVVYVFFLCNESWIYGVVAIPKEYTHLMFFTMLLQGCKQTYLTKERALYRYKSVAVISVLSLVLPTLLSLVAVILVPEELHLAARMYGFYVPYALIGGYCGIRLLSDSRTFRGKYLKYAFRLGLPLFVHYLTSYILTSTNTILTKSILGAEEAAKVSIITSVMNILFVLSQAVTGAMSIWIMDNLELGRTKNVQKCTMIFTLGAMMLTAMIMLLGPEVIWILGGSKYRGAIDLLPGMAMAAFFQLLTNLQATLLTYAKKLERTAIATGILAVGSLLVKIWLLPEYGVNVLPVVNVITFVFVVACSYMVVAKTGYSQCLSMKLVIAASCALLALVLVCPLLYSSLLVRYGVVGLVMVVCGLVAYKNKELWLPILMKKLRKKNSQ